MKIFLSSTLITTLVLLVIGAVLYFHAQAQCAPIIQERIARGHDNAPTLCGAEFYIYLPIAAIIWLSFVLGALFRMIKERNKK